jgi:hypothetical protein
MIIPGMQIDLHAVGVVIRIFGEAIFHFAVPLG